MTNNARIIEMPRSAPIEPKTGFTSPKIDSLKEGSLVGRTSTDGPLPVAPFSRTTSIHCRPSFSGAQSMRIVPRPPSATSTSVCRRTSEVPSARTTEMVASVVPSKVPTFLTKICTAVESPVWRFNREYSIAGVSSSNFGCRHSMSHDVIAFPADCPSPPRTRFPARSRPSTRTNTVNRSMSMSSVMTLKSIVPVPTRLRPLISVPCKRKGLLPSRINSPVTVSSTHHASRSDSKSIPPSSERTMVTSCSCAERIEPGRGVCTS